MSAHDPNIFVEKVIDCENIESIRTFNASSPLSAHDYSQRIFGGLLDRKRPIGMLLDFLEDPALNCLGSNNLRSLLLWDISHQFTFLAREQHMSTFIHWFRIQVMLGNLSESELFSLAEYASSLANNLHNDSRVYHIVEAILEGIELCPVLKPSDINTRTFGELFYSINHGTWTLHSQILGLKLLSMLEEPQLRQLADEVAMFLLRSFTATIEAARVEEYSSAEIPATLEGKLLSMMKRLSSSARTVIIDVTSRLLIARCKVVDQELGTLLSQTWWTYLARHSMLSLFTDSRGGVERCKLVWAQKVELIAPFAQHLDCREFARFVFQQSCQVTVTALAEFNERLTRINPRTALAEVVQRAYSSTMAMAPLFGKLFSLLQTMQREEEIIALVENADCFHYKIPESEILASVRSLLPGNSYVACHIILSDSRPLLESCPELAEHIVLRDRNHPETVWAYVRRKTTDAGGDAFASNLDDWRRNRAVLLARTAMAFSLRPGLSSSIAFRNVVQLRKQHGREMLGPVGRIMSRSLVRAGLVLPLQRNEGLSDSKIRFILSVIKCSEGIETANLVDKIIHLWRNEVNECRRRQAD